MFVLFTKSASLLNLFERSEVLTNLEEVLKLFKDSSLERELDDEVEVGEPPGLVGRVGGKCEVDL